MSPGLSEQDQEIILYLKCIGGWHLLIASVAVMIVITVLKDDDILLQANSL